MEFLLGLFVGLFVAAHAAAFRHYIEDMANTVFSGVIKRQEHYLAGLDRYEALADAQHEIDLAESRQRLGEIAVNDTPRSPFGPRSLSREASPLGGRDREDERGRFRRPDSARRE